MTFTHLAQQAGDMIGTVAFAISGALLAIRKGFDIVGVATLAVITAVGGGIMRDLVIGQTPPVAFTDLRYASAALVTALVIFVWSPPESLLGRPLDLADALGLGMFCVTGTVSAHLHGLGPESSTLLGAVTAVGGGVLRDLLAQETPSILRRDKEIYAIPALVGSAVTASLLFWGIYSALAGIGAALGVFVFRVLALRWHWRAPRARQRTS